MHAARRVLAPGAAPLLAYLVVFLVLPAGVLLLYSLWRASFFEITRDFTLANYVRILAQPIYLHLILKSLGVGLMVAAVTVPVSFLLAHVITFRLRRWGTAVLVLVMLSMLSSYLVRIYAWKTILGPMGAINQALLGLGLIAEPLDFLLYGNFAVVVTLTHILIPYAVLPIYSALQNIDRQVLEASRDLGADRRMTFWRTLLPLAMPGVAAAFLFTFILAAADYVTPQLVGGNSGILVGRVIADQYGLSGNPPFGAALSVGLMLGFAVVVGVLWLARFALRHLPRRLFRWRRPQIQSAGRPMLRLPWAVIAAFALLIFLYAPLLIVLIFSFNDSTSGVFPLKGLTLRWYAELFASAAFLNALKATLIVAAAAVAGSLAIGVAGAFALVRRRFLLRRVLGALVIGPIAVPGVVIGVAFISALAVMGLQAGLVPTMLAHILFTLPFVVMVLRARLLDFDRQVEEAARDLGSSPLRTLRTVTLPLIGPSVVGAGILVFALSIDEFIVTNFVIGANATLPVYIWSQMRLGINPSVNALSTVILVGSLSLVCIAGAVIRRRGNR